MKKRVIDVKYTLTKLSSDTENLNILIKYKYSHSGGGFYSGVKMPRVWCDP